MRKNRCIGDESVQKRKTMMGVCWMLMILLCCVSSHATQCPRTNASRGQLKSYCVPEQGHISVFVPCPNVTSEEKTYKLLKHQTVIHKCMLSNGETKTCEAQNGSQVDVQFKNKEKSPGFTANVTGQAIYTCEAELDYPPPFIKIPSEQVVIVTEGCCCQCNKTNHNDTRDVKEPERRQNQKFLWIWITVVVLLSTYGLAVTIVAFIIWFKLKSADSQNDYINTKPAKQRKNKNKVQNPIPRYF
ncbi:uncharacterized protein si:dkey-1h24.6 [Melanotaenia boesemani]|uniref:uncharacterized protein si:dkey-1h24.6 n=1 Tax=Melanotaenia boesemani TaxID=1250792 RepID=UPI001C048818|nr:uncharacterized protein si:dkey-1h24.6 [Melanotaenia boesemani]